MNANAARRPAGDVDDAPAPVAKRDAWVLVVSPAGRDAIDKALAVSPPLGAVELRIVMAVVRQTALWSKLAEDVYLEQLAAMAGIGGSPPEDADKAQRWAENRRKTVGRALRRLAQLGVVLYRPARGRGLPSWVGLPSLSSSASGKGGVGTPLLDPPENDKEVGKGGEGDPKRGRTGSEKGAAGPPLTSTTRSRSKTPDARARTEAVENRPDGDRERPGVFDRSRKGQDPPPGQALLEAVAQAAPNLARHQLLDDVDQAAGRAALCRALAELEDLVGFDAAVVVVTGEWPDRPPRSAMAFALSRVDKRLGGRSPPPTSTNPGPVEDEDEGSPLFDWRPPPPYPSKRRPPTPQSPRSNPGRTRQRQTETPSVAPPVRKAADDVPPPRSSRPTSTTASEPGTSRSSGPAPATSPAPPTHWPRSMTSTPWSTSSPWR